MTTTSNTLEPLERNLNMPFMKFNWAAHDTWCHHMTFEERGLYDAARSVLWSVVNCKMPLEMLRKRLGIKDRTKNDKLLLGLISSDSLRFVDGKVFDSVQVNEFTQAVSIAKVNKANGHKGGRPKLSSVPPESETVASEAPTKDNPDDF
jgi:hypothetical protein